MSHHPLGGLYKLSKPIPAWEKGSKVSDTSEDDFVDGYYDSSDVSSEAVYGIDSSDSESANNVRIVDADKTPRKKQLSKTKPKLDKGKGKAVDGQSENANEQTTPVLPSNSPAASSAKAKQPSSRPSSSRQYRPRAGSSSRHSSLSISPARSQDHIPALDVTAPVAASAPGSAAKSFSSFTKEAAQMSGNGMCPTSTASNAPSSSFSRVPMQRSNASPGGLLSASPLAAPPVLGARTFASHARRQSRGLGRAQSAPMSVFGGSAPSPKTPSTSFSRSTYTKTPRSAHQPLPSGETFESSDTEEIEQPSDTDSLDARELEMAVEEVIQRAFDTRDGNVELVGKSLASIPASIADLSKIISLDPKTGQSVMTDVRLYLTNNFITSSGLPQELFHMQNLSTLGLRSNQIRELPQSIENLKSLRELVLFNNKLTYLPAEILSLRLENLNIGSNPFVRYPATLTSDDSPVEKTNDVESSNRKHRCEPRRANFAMPSLVELVTRKLLEPLPSASRTASSIPSPSVKRYFHLYKDEAISPRTDTVPLPPHLLKPFLPLLRPSLPQHLRSFAAECDRISEQTPPSSPSDTKIARLADLEAIVHQRQTRGGGNWRDLLLCSVCKTACAELAETRVEWRNEIAGVKLASDKDKNEWIPLLWRGCSTQCLDFLDQ